MTITGRSHDRLAVLRDMKSVSPSHSLGTVQEERMARIEETVAALSGRVEYLERELARRDALVEEMREAHRMWRGMLALGEVMTNRLGLALHRLDDGEDGLTETVVDLRVQSEGRLP